MSYHWRIADDETAARYSAWIDALRPLADPRVPNTFRRSPVPRLGFIDARRDDGCVPTITTLEA